MDEDYIPFESDMDSMSPPADQASDTIARNAVTLDSLTPTASNAAPTNDCEFTFIGGAGTGGPYLDSFRRAFEKAGIQHVRVPNQGGSTGDPRQDAPAYRIAPDVLGVPMVNDLTFAKELVNDPSIQAAARHSRSLGDEQYNLGGYSYGAAAQAANAYAIAENGGRVDNLVLLGAPINKDLYDAVKNHPNIKNVITLDLGAYGDPVHAGMTDAEFERALPTLGGQFLTGLYGGGNVGHFYYSGAGPIADQRRNALARSLVQRGVR